MRPALCSKCIPASDFYYLNFVSVIVARHRNPCFKGEVGEILTRKHRTAMVRIKILKKALKIRGFKQQ